MKKVTRCGGCGKIVREYGSYTAELTEKPVVNGMPMPEIKRVIKLCRKCASEAGYKVKGMDE